MEPLPFRIPKEQNPEPGQPEEIEHGCDYMCQPDGTVEFYYNFLIYTWAIGGEAITARAYLDDQSTVSVFVAGARLRGDPALRPLVHYLQRRFRMIRSFHADDPETQANGYVLHYQREFTHRRD